MKSKSMREAMSAVTMKHRMPSPANTKLIVLRISFSAVRSRQARYCAMNLTNALPYPRSSTPKYQVTDVVRAHSPYAERPRCDTLNGSIMRPMMPSTRITR